jgi:hypothetical protein
MQASCPVLHGLRAKANIARCYPYYSGKGYGEGIAFGCVEIGRCGADWYRFSPIANNQDNMPRSV